MDRLFLTYSLLILLCLASLGLLALSASADLNLLQEEVDASFGIDVKNIEGQDIEGNNLSLNDDEASKRAKTESHSDHQGLNNLALRQLFGVFVEDADIDVERLPETQLELELQGTFSHTDSTLAGALISTLNRSQKKRFFMIGDEVTENTTLVKVRDTQVVLRRNGRDEVLSLPRFGEVVVGPEVDIRRRLKLQLQGSYNNNNTLAVDSLSAPTPVNIKPSGMSLKERLQRLRQQRDAQNNTNND